MVACAARFFRLRNAPVERPYRCDSPEKKCYMKMIICPLEEGYLSVEHRVEKVEERSKPVTYLTRERKEVTLSLQHLWTD